MTLLRTMSHELTHALQQNSPAQYEALKNAVLDVLTSKSGVSIEEMAARKMEQDSSLKKPDVALDEVVAEACENMLRDSDAMEQLIAQHPAEAKTFLEKVKQFFTDIVNAIRAAFGGSDTSRSREATALMQQAEEYLDICEKWSKALQDTAEISGRMDRQTGDGDVQYSLRDEIEFMEDKYYTRLIDRFEEQHPSGYTKVGRVIADSILNKVGLPEADLFFDNAKIAKALNEHSDHLEKRILKRIPEILRNPVVIAEDSRENNINVFGDVWVGNSPILVGVVITTDRAGKNTISKIRTVHARKDAAQKINDRNILYLDSNKKRTRGWFQALGTHLPTGGTRFGFIRSIAPSDGSVKFSLRENVEQTKDLVAVHNLTEEKLLNAMNLGGFPMPSIAVTKSSIGHNTFGDISLVFGRETIDPKASRKNKVYSADAWTPTFPRIEYEADTRAGKRVDARIRELTSKIPADYQRYMYQYGDLTDLHNRYGGKDGIVKKAFSDSGMRAAYVADMGGDVTMEKKNVTVSGVSDAMGDKYMRTLALFNYDVDEMMHTPLAQLKDVPGLGEIWSEQTTRDAGRTGHQNRRKQRRGCDQCED